MRMRVQVGTQSLLSESWPPTYFKYEEIIVINISVEYLHPREDEN